MPIRVCRQAPTPVQNSTAEAKHAVEYYHAQGGGSIYDPTYGKFHDEATIKACLVDLAKAVQAGKLDAAWLAAQAAKSKEVTGYDILQVMGRVA